MALFALGLTSTNRKGRYDDSFTIIECDWCQNDSLRCLLSWWRHQMQTFPRYWPFVRGIHRSLVNSANKGQWRRALMFLLICTWTNGWANNRDAGDLRRHRAHHDVTVIDCSSFIRHLWQSTKKHIKWSSKVLDENNIIRAYNHTTYIKRSYSASQVSCTHVLVVWIYSNQFHASRIGQHCHWCISMVLPQCQSRTHGWQAHLLTHERTQYL